MSLDLWVFLGFCWVTSALCDLPPLLLPCCSPQAHSSPTKLFGTLPPLPYLSPLPGTLFPQVLPWLTPTPPSSLCSRASKLRKLQSPRGKLQCPPHAHTTLFCKSCSNFFHSTYHQHTPEQCCFTELSVMMETVFICAMSYM